MPGRVEHAGAVRWTGCSGFRRGDVLDLDRVSCAGGLITGR